MTKNLLPNGKCPEDDIDALMYAGSAYTQPPPIENENPEL